MYLEYYELASTPFENTPDPAFFFASEAHREALAAIEYTIRMRKGFVLVTGPVGSGKTTIGHTMIHRCGEDAQIVQVLHGHRTADELLKQIMRALGVPFRRADEHGLLLERLYTHLTQRMDANRPVVLLVDEAQTLTEDALEELRLLANLDTAHRQLMQIVLIGQNDLLDRIAAPGLASLRQRIVLARKLKALDPRQTNRYIRHRLQVASKDSGHVRVRFEPEAVARIYQHSGGAPRTINILCDNSLLLGYVRHTSRRIDESIVREVIAEMLPNLEPEIDRKPHIVTDEAVARKVGPRAAAMAAH